MVLDYLLVVSEFLNRLVLIYKLLSVGLGRSCSIWSRWIAARYTFEVLYEMACDTSAQKYYKVREDVGRGEILNCL